MAPSTALVEILLCVALALQQIGALKQLRTQLLQVLCGIVVLLVGDVLWSHATGGVSRWQTWLERVLTHGQAQGFPQMAVPTAALLLLSVFTLLALDSPFGKRKMLRDAGIVVALLILIFGFVALIAFAAGNPLGVTSGWLPFVRRAIIGILVFNFLLLLAPTATNRLRQWFFGGDDSDDAPLRTPREERLVLALLVCIGVVATAASIFYLRIRTHRQQSQTIEAVVTLTDLKMREVTQWRRERLADAHALTHLSILAESAAAAPGDRASNLMMASVRDWLPKFGQDYGYTKIIVFNAKMEPIATYPAGVRPDAPGLREKFAALQADSGVVELAPYLIAADKLRWDLLAPLRVPGSATLSGAVWLQTDPAKSIFRGLKWWPKDYRTGQTVLWFHEGNRLVAMSGVREAPGIPAEQTLPFAETRTISALPRDSLLARVLRREASADEGLSHAGVPILGYGVLIRDSPWLLTTRVDSSEVYEPLRRDAWVLAGFVIGLLGTASVATSWLWRQRQRDLLHGRLSAELEQKRIAARLGMVMQNAKDIILVLDDQLRIDDANQQAVDTYGWTREELVTMSARDLRTAETVAGFYDASARVRVADGATYETVHRRKDGSTLPVEVSSRRVEIDGRTQWLSIVRDITERKRAEAVLRESEERYRLIAENTSDIIWLYDQSTDAFTYASPAVLPMLGYQPEEIVGRKLLSFLVPESHDHARRTLAQAIRSANDTRAPVHLAVELIHQRKDGRTIPTEVVTSVLSDSSGCVTHILGVTRDITERKKARETLEKFNAELEQQVETRTSELAARNHEIQGLLDAMPDTVLLCDERGKLISARSTRYPEVVGLVTGRPLPASRPALDQALLGIIRDMHAAALAEKQSVSQEFEVSVENDRRIFLEARATLIGAARVLILVRDITGRKQTERATLANLERERQLSDLKSQFISVASHEFRTPLAAAVGSLELLEKHSLRLTEAKRVELITRIQRSLSRLTTIMNDVLHLSRADSGRVKVQRMNVDLVRFVRDIIQEIETGDAQKHGFFFQHRGGGDAVAADTKLLHHIFSNLMSNAVRYSPAGTKIAVTLELTPEAFTLVVADEGIGIPEAERDRIFEPFVRGSNVGAIGGTGLGLNIVKRYTELMGGRIELLPSARGAHFSVTIPLNPPAS